MKKERRSKKWFWPILMFIVFLFCFALIFIKLAYISLSTVVDSINLQEFALNRNTVKKTLYADRGNIYDNSGNVLATTVYSYTVIAILSDSREDRVIDKVNTAKLLSPLINMTEEKILSLLNKKLYQVELGPGGRNISLETKQKIVDLKLPGIQFVEYKKRYYPNGRFASYTIGYAKQYEEQVTINGSTMTNYIIVGELGIESMFEEYLKGKNGYIVKQVDRDGIQIPNTPEEYEEKVDGADVYLTLDSNVQRFIETALTDLSKTYKPSWAAITVMDAKTGNILGTSSNPSFNPNTLDITNYENKLVSYLYEPGSVMKIYTYMCAIESGKYNGKDTFKSGSIKIGDDKIKDWNTVGFGTISYDLGFEYSSNVGVSNLVQKVIDRQELKQCLTDYGFGQKTEIELARELKGDIGFVYPVEVANAGFGQGISTTMIQHLQALTILANDGYMLKPHIVSKIVTKDGNTLYESKVEKSEKQIVSAKTITKIKSLMHNVIYGDHEFTTGSPYAIKGFDLLGKTGTAQIYDSKAKKYKTNVHIRSFAGIFPANDPQIIIYALMEIPSTGSSAGLAKASKSVMKNVSKYLNIFTDENTANTEIIVADSYLNKETETVKNDLISKGLNVYVLGDGNRIISQYPIYLTKLLPKEKIMLLTNGSKIVMPDITGFSRIEAISLFKLLNIKYTIEGNGYVYSQSIKTGEVINENSEILIKLK